jgi:hypothetical protein
MEGPIRVKELRDIAPEIPAAQTSLKSDKIFSKALLGSYLRFQERNEYQS